MADLMKEIKRMSGGCPVQICQEDVLYSFEGLKIKNMKTLLDNLQPCCKKIQEYQEDILYSFVRQKKPLKSTFRRCNLKPCCAKKLNISRCLLLENKHERMSSPGDVK